MPVTATLVVGRDGSTTKGGRSSGVATAADREAFLARRRKADCIIIGGNTARNEPYQRTPAPVVVLSRSMVNSLEHNHRAYWWNVAPAQAIIRARRLFGENILVEAGPQLLALCVDEGLIDILELSVTEIADGENFLDFDQLLSKFATVEEKIINGTRFITAWK